MNEREVIGIFDRLKIYTCPYAPLAKDADEALEFSIIKWENIIHHLKQGYCVTQDGGSSCALCIMFQDVQAPQCQSDCEGFPVKMRTELRYCKGTPFGSYVMAFGDEKIANAEKMLEFLRGL